MTAKDKQQVDADNRSQVGIDKTAPKLIPTQKEVGGRNDGPDPTRYGDWEKNGRCVDF